MGITIGVVRPLVESVIGKAKATTDQPIVITARMQKLIGISFSEAQRMGENWIGTEHLLLGLLVEREGIAARFCGNSESLLKPCGARSAVSNRCL